MLIDALRGAVVVVGENLPLVVATSDVLEVDDRLVVGIGT